MDLYQTTIYGINMGKTKQRDILHQNFSQNPKVEYMQVNNAIQEMVMDVAGPCFNQNDNKETPNIATRKLYDMLRASEQEV